VAAVVFWDGTTQARDTMATDLDLAPRDCLLDLVVREVRDEGYHGVGGEMAGQWQRGQQTANFRLTTAAYSLSLQARGKLRL